MEPAGEGASGIVWRAARADTGRLAAVKVAKPGAPLARERELLARLRRRWGPSLLDAGPSYIALEWCEGSPLQPAEVRGDREEVAAIVAHAVARALEELHGLGVRHGDVKPANILLAKSKRPTRDAAHERGATLIDLSLGGAFDEVHGGSRRYLAPELVAGGPAGPGADLWALGIVLAEILDAKVARADDPAGAVAAWGRPSSEIAAWVQVLLSRAPGARPSAAWIASRAAERLRLAPDAGEQVATWQARVRRAYLALRAHEIRKGAFVAESVTGEARAWLDEALAWAARTEERDAGGEIGKLTALQRARWLVLLAGPAAAWWPTPDEDDGGLARRFLSLAERVDPSAWTLGDLAGARAREQDAEALDTNVLLARELLRARPDPRALSAAEARMQPHGAEAAALGLLLAEALLRSGDVGRAWIAASRLQGERALALLAEIARRRGDAESAKRLAERAGARPTLARLAWDAGDMDGALRALGDARGPAAAEVRALVAWSRGAHEEGLRVLQEALGEDLDLQASARLEGTRGMLEHAAGRSAASLEAFSRAVELASRVGAVVEEATYLTGEASAAADAGAVGRALAAATRASLLWERLGEQGRAARALLARAAALATVGAQHLADEAARESRERARASGDALTAAYAEWPVVETRPPGDDEARARAVSAARELANGAAADAARAAARLLVWAPEAIDDARVAEVDGVVAGCAAPVRFEWWGARARSWLGGRRVGSDADILAALSALVDTPAPLGSRGPALDAAARLAHERGDGDAARRFEAARRDAARQLREGTPAELASSLAAVPWARLSAAVAGDEVGLGAAQIGQLEAIVRALATRDRLKPLLEQILDTMVLWTGVERGALLLPAPDGRLVPRVARNLARRDLRGEQLALSRGLAQRALDSREPVVATDALSSLGDLHASVHALGLRSVLAVPLLARGQALGVVYLDDRARKGAFGARELAWVRLVASQAAAALADARDQALLRRAVRRAERARVRLASVLREREAELDAARAELRLAREQTKFAYDAIVGRSEALLDTLKLVDRVTPTDIPVLLIGESGTGKELIARAIHANGPRARRPFVSENCASVPETLLESTLFGHVRGAFTGATSTRAGLFDVADGGTLFLDEVGEMSPAMQVKLLRVLQEGEVRPVGGERPRKVDVRVICATHRDLEAMVAEGTFREDLFYRLNVVAVRVPPLRERREDIPLLVAHFMEKHGSRAKIARAALDRLVAYPWPGNIRQLENEVRRAIVLADEHVEVQHLSADVVRGGPEAARGAGLDLRSRVDALERDLLREALAKTKGNQTKAAELLGVSRFGLQKMLRRLNVTM
jgi:transcriptional regulator with GAF, ATPase, and Fis domain